MGKRAREKEIDPRSTTKGRRRADMVRLARKVTNPAAYGLDDLSKPKALGSYTDATEKPIMPALKYQKTAINCESQFQIWIWSRQTGKSWSMAQKIVKRAMKTGRNQIVLSASQFQADELMEKVRGVIEAFQELAIAIIGEKAYRVRYKRQRMTKRIFTLTNGARIISLPANPRTARGFTGDVYLDEFALHRWDRQIWGSIYATVTRNGGMVTVASTPMGTQNMFYELCNNASYTVFKVTIYDAVEQGYPANPEKLKAGLGDEELWQQEYLVMFLDEATAYLTHELISGCEQLCLGKYLPDDFAPEGTIYIGVDVGRKKDLTVIWIWEKLGDVFWTRAVVELRNVPFAKQEELVTQYCRLPKFRRACIDATGLGMELAENVQAKVGKQKVEAVTFTQAVKADLAGPMRIKAEDRLMRIPVDRDIRNDFHSIKKIVTSSGNIRFEADRGPNGHADRFWSAALGLHAAETSRSGGGCWSPRRKVA